MFVVRHAPTGLDPPPLLFRLEAGGGGSVSFLLAAPGAQEVAGVITRPRFRFVGGGRVTARAHPPGPRLIGGRCEK